MERILNNKNMLRFRVIIERNRRDEAIQLALFQGRRVKEKPCFHFMQCWLSPSDSAIGETTFVE
jgi:hypothetical protein